MSSRRSPLRSTFFLDVELSPKSIEISEVAVAGLGPVALAVAGLVPGVPGSVSDRTKRHAGLGIGPNWGLYCQKINLTS